MRGARAKAWPQVDFSERLQSCLIPSSHGNRRLWCTWPTYVLYVHKHAGTICYWSFFTLGCQDVEWLLNETIRDCKNKLQSQELLLLFWEAVNEFCQQKLSHIETSSLSAVITVNASGCYCMLSSCLLKDIEENMLWIFVILPKTYFSWWIHFKCPICHFSLKYN